VDLILETLRVTAAARSVALVALHGGVIAQVGDRELNPVVLMRTATMRLRASLAKGVEAARLPPESVFELDGGIVLHMTRVKHALLVVKFHRDESALGLVKLRARKAVEELEALLDQRKPSSMPPIGGSGGPTGIPNELRVVEPVPEERPKPKKVPIGRRKKISRRR
jgi:hypothetical protein